MHFINQNLKHQLGVHQNIFSDILSSSKKKRILKKQQQIQENRDLFQSKISKKNNAIQDNFDYLQYQIDLLKQNKDQLDVKRNEINDQKTYYQQNDDFDFNQESQLIFQKINKKNFDKEQVYDTQRAQDQLIKNNILSERKDLKPDSKKNHEKQRKHSVQQIPGLQVKQKNFHIKDISQKNIKFNYLDMQERKKLMQRKQLSTHIF